MFDTDLRGPKALMWRDLRLKDLILGLDIDLKLILAYLIAMYIFIFIPGLGQSIVRQIIGMALLLLIPGYALAALLFPGKSDIGSVERFVLSFTFSVVIVALLGLALNYTPPGIRLVPLTACISIFILACTLPANWRRHGLPEEYRFSPGPGDVFRLVQSAFKAIVGPGEYGFFNRALNVIVLFSMALAAGTLAYAVVQPGQGETFTEFYILGPDGKADNYPANVILGNETRVIAGVVNHEGANEVYSLAVSLNNSSQDTRLYSENLTLADNQTWEKPIDIKPDRNGTNMKLSFLLYRDGNATPYRELHIWMNVTAPGET